MIEGLKPYPGYQESGECWIGPIPASWRIRRAKFLFREIDERSKTGKEELLSVSHKTGVTPRTQKSVTMFLAESNVGHKICRPQDLVINTLWAWMAALGVSRHTGIVSPAYGVYRLTAPDQFLPRFADLLLRTPMYAAEYQRRSTGVNSSRLRLYAEYFFRIPIILPPHDEQLAIVRFLDHANRKIDGFIRAKRKLIGLLNEQKQAIIHRAVTRGLDPNAKLKPSGIPWLVEIPAHWEVRRVKQVAKILRGKFTHRPRNDPSLYDGIYPFIQTGAVARAKKFITEYKQTLNERGLAVSKMFPKGTLCMTIAANIGDVAILDFEACFPDSIVGFVPSSDLNRDFLYLAFLCLKAELLSDAPVNTQGNLNVERIGVKWLPFPPLEEQQQIAAQVELETSVFATAIARTEREIALMQEYRTRLTADIVTGKLDVREAAAKLPEELDEEPAADEVAEEPETEEFAE